jgi:hypothetical protein
MLTSGSRIVLFLSFVAGSLLVGCSDPNSPQDDTPPAGVSNETQAMEYLARGDEFVSNEDVTFSDVALQPTDYGTFGKVATDVIPITWGRFVDQVTISTTTTIEEGDTTAVVQVVKDISGTFRVLAKYSETDTSTVLIEKPFNDQSVRNVIFRRTGRETRRFWLNWAPIASSLVEGATVAPPADQAVAITKLEFIRPDGDTITVTDPLSFFLRFPWRFRMMHQHAPHEVPQMNMGETFALRATVVSASPDTDLVVLRYGFSLVSRKRMSMPLVEQTENGDGTYTRVYQIAADVRHQPGFFHAGVVALSRKTLFDDDPASYSVSWWGVPYRVL